MSSTTKKEDSRSINDQLVSSIHEGYWPPVVWLHKKNVSAFTHPVDNEGNTALHLAIIEEQEGAAQRLLQIILSKKPQINSVLQAKNKAGYTPLHYAAVLGNAKICHWILTIDPTLVGVRSDGGETPIISAALGGKKDAFLRLHYSGDDSTIKNNSSSYEAIIGNIRTEDDTILHMAIAWDLFELAFHIIHQYENLVDAVNAKGFTPIEVLARKPSVFKSSIKFGGWKRIIYELIYVDKLKHDTSPGQIEGLEDEEISRWPFPENYKTCFDFIGLLTNAANCVFSKRDRRHDMEIPQEGAHREKNLDDRQKQPSKHQHVIITYFRKFLSKAILMIFEDRYSWIRTIREQKEKHEWAVQVLDELLSHTKHVNEQKFSIYVNEEGDQMTKHEYSEVPTMESKQKAILNAARFGVVEMVERILETFPTVINTIDDANRKNIGLLAVEHRQPLVFKLILRGRHLSKGNLFKQVDKKGNSVLHLAAMLPPQNNPWPVSGAVLQMQWEIKWFKFIKESLPVYSYIRYNDENKTPEEVFSEKHEKLVEESVAWLSNIANNCSVVAGLFVTLTFNTSTSIPGGVKEETGTPYLKNQPAFDVFAISSQVAFYSSVISLVMFLAILTSGYQMRDFNTALPRKLLLGLTALYLCIASTLVSFCSAHFFVLQTTLKQAASPVYGATCALVTLFVIVHFPLYFHMVRATFKKIPDRRSRQIVAEYLG